MKMIKLMKKIKDVSVELDEAVDTVSWIDKWRIIDLQRKSEILLEDLKQFQLNSSSREEEPKQKLLITTAEQFLTEIRTVIQQLIKTKEIKCS